MKTIVDFQWIWLCVNKFTETNEIVAATVELKVDSSTLSFIFTFSYIQFESV